MANDKKYIDKDYLVTQFTNFATRISNVFAKKSELPTVNDGTLTIKQNGTTKGSFTANQAGDIEIDIVTSEGNIKKHGATPVTTQHIVTWYNDDEIQDSGYTIETSVPANAVFTDTTYSEATTTDAGLMSAGDKAKLDKISSTPMQFKGSLGVGGTIQVLPTADPTNDGWTYIVITEATYGTQYAKEGDLFISNGSSWVYVPSADEKGIGQGTVTSVDLANGGGIDISGSPITTSGTITVTNTGVRGISIDSNGTISANTNGVSADIISVETSDIDMSKFF